MSFRVTIGSWNIWSQGWSLFVACPRGVWRLGWWR